MDKQAQQQAEIEQALANLDSGETWDTFCDLLKEAGRKVVQADNAPSNPLDRAEGYRYLARLTRASLKSYLEAADTTAPVFSRAVDETIKMGMDNPDNVYLAAPINGKYQYKITGTRGTVHYLGFGTQAGGYGKTGSLDTTGYLEAKDLSFDADGRFEIILSSEKPDKAANWLPMSLETRLVQVRQTRQDHKNEVLADVHIERIDGSNKPRPFEPYRVDKALKSAAFFVHMTSDLFKQWTEDFKQHTNELPRFNPDKALQAGGDPNIAYYHSYFKIADDEALEITLHPPECDFWNFQLGNYWLESLDYRYHDVHINPFTAKYAEDGSVRIILSKHKPLDIDLQSDINWMDSCNRNEGTMCVRWIRASSHPDPSVRLIKLSSLEPLSV